MLSLQNMSALGSIFNHYKWCIVAILLVCGASAAHATPPATKSNTGILEMITEGTAFDNDLKIQPILQKTMIDIVNANQESSIKTGNAIMKHTRAVFFAILGLVISAQITFMGFKIMLRTSVVESLTQFTVSSFILAVVAGLTAHQTPATIIETAMYQLMGAGRNVGAEIIQSGLAGDKNAVLKTIAASMQTNSPVTNGPGDDIIPAASIASEPAVYWLTWIGVDHAQDIDRTQTTKAIVTESRIQQTKANEATEYKFSTSSLMARFWGDPDWGKAIPVEGTDSYKKIQAGLTEAISNVAAAMLVAMAPFRALGMAMTIGTIQTGAVLAPVMQQIGVFVGAMMTFYVVTSLGVATLPLIYFNTFRSLWSNYLTVITGIALIPCFYYIFSAVGFVFAANTFETLFPIPDAAGAAGAPQSFAVVLNTVYMRSCAVALANVSELMSGATGMVTPIISWIFGWSMLLGRITFASGVVASVVTGGIAFAMMGGQVAYRWAQGFGAESMTDRVAEFFSGIQSSVGSGLSAMYSNFVNRASQGAAGVSKALGG